MLIMGNISFWRTFNDKNSSRLATSRPLAWRAERALFVPKAADRGRLSRERPYEIGPRTFLKV